MSTVAVKIDEIYATNYVTMAGDRQASQDSWGTHSVTKVWHIGDSLVGLVGELGKGLQVVEWIRNGSIKAEPPTFPTEEMKGGNFILLIWNGVNILTLDEQGFFVIVEEMSFAIGSGAQAARGAMKMGADVKLAIEIASEIDESTGMGTDVVKVVL